MIQAGPFLKQLRVNVILVDVLVNNLNVVAAAASSIASLFHQRRQKQGVCMMLIQSASGIDAEIHTVQRARCVIW